MIPELIIGLSIVGLVLYNLWRDEDEEDREAESALAASLRDRFTRF